MGTPFEDGHLAYEDELLSRFCRRVEDRWAFRGESARYSRSDALGLIRAYLGLGLEPTSILTAKAFVALYDRLVALEKDLQHSQLKP